MSFLTRLFSGYRHDMDIAMTPEKDYTRGKLQEIINQQTQYFVARGITVDTTVLLYTDRSFDHAISLLSLMDIGCPVILCNECLAHLSTPRPSLCIHFLVYSRQSVERTESSQQVVRPNQAKIATLSSGSTGAPKLIWHSIDNFIASATASNTLLPLNNLDRSLMSLPIFHVGGLGIIFRALVSNSVLVFDVDVKKPENFEKFLITRASLVPTQLEQLLKCEPSKRLKLSILLGGAAISTQLLQQARKSGYNIHQTYGLSETASQVITEVHENQWQCLPHASVRIINGEVFVCAESLFIGYERSLKFDPPKLTSDGFATNDLAEFNGPIFEFKGRRDNMFTSGGENVYPETIERLVQNSTSVNTLVVVPIADPKWGHVPIAFIQPATKQAADQCRAFAEASLLPHQRPSNYYGLPEQTGLKIQRTSLIKKVINHDLEKIG